MMKELLKKLQKKSNKKGFTLVEIIVVLVILAILAAIAVPSVLGYVNEAKDEKYIQEAHSIYTVIQTEEAKYKATENVDDLTKFSYGKHATTKAESTGVVQKAWDMTDIEVLEITKDSTKEVYTVKWNEDNKGITATINKNKDVKISKGSVIK